MWHRTHFSSCLNCSIVILRLLASPICHHEVTHKTHSKTPTHCLHKKLLQFGHFLNHPPHYSFSLITQNNDRDISLTQQLVTMQQNHTADRQLTMYGLTWRCHYTILLIRNYLLLNCCLHKKTPSEINFQLSA